MQNNYVLKRSDDEVEICPLCGEEWVYGHYYECPERDRSFVCDLELADECGISELCLGRTVFQDRDGDLWMYGARHFQWISHKDFRDYLIWYRDRLRCESSELAERADMIERTMAEICS